MKKRIASARPPTPPNPLPPRGVAETTTGSVPGRTVSSRPRGIGPGRRAFVACVALLAASMAASGSAAVGPAMSTGVKLRQARSAVADGHLDAARAALEQVRTDEESGPRWLEATILLADVSFSAGNPQDADRLLGEIESDALDGDRARVQLSRAWLALARGDVGLATSRFAALMSEGDGAVREPATLGAAWTALIAGHTTSLDDLEPLRRMARRSADPALRFGAGWTLGRAHQIAGRSRHALRELRLLRRLARGTPYEDDVELEIALAQISSGVPASARHTLDRLARRHDPGEAPPPLITLDQLRASPPRLVAHIAHAYAARSERFVGPLGFLAGVLNRPAAADVPAALELAASEPAERYGAARGTGTGTGTGTGKEN